MSNTSSRKPSPYAAESFTALLKAHGYRVDMQSNFLAAIEAANQSACDGYPDIGLPDIDGYELAQTAVRLTVLREAVHARCRYLQTRKKSLPARAQRARPATSFSSQVSEGRLIP
jgi:CheY-like chemotaxis protein